MDSLKNIWIDTVKENLKKGGLEVKQERRMCMISVYCEGL